MMNDRTVQQLMAFLMDGMRCQGVTTYDPQSKSPCPKVDPPHQPTNGEIV